MTKIKTELSNEAQPAFAQPLVSGRAVKVGDYAKVFDADKWHGDRGDNSDFWQRAKILKVYWYEAKIGSSDWVVDVLFDDGRESKAHFLTGIEPCH